MCVCVCVCVWCVCECVCVHVPGVWKLMRLISTGSVGLCAIISALLSKHLVPGSDSLRLLMSENTHERGETAVMKEMDRKKNQRAEAESQTEAVRL